MSEAPFKHGELVRDASGQTLRWCRCCMRCHAAFFMCPAYESALREKIIKERTDFLHGTLRAILQAPKGELP